MDIIILKRVKLALEEVLMNKKSAEYLRKLGYSVEEHIYQKEPPKNLKEPAEREKILVTKFQAVSDIEIIEELRKRVSKQEIKLSMYQNQEHIFIVAKDEIKQVSFPLPIEIKPEVNHD